MTLPTVSAGGASASGSYPNFSMRSCSSFAFFSASSKSSALASTFLAPSFFFAPKILVFLAPVVAVFRTAAAGIARGAAAEGSVADSGDLERAGAVPLPLALRKGEAVLLIPGVVDREGGLLGRLMVGLSHDEKKSSSCSPAGVFVPLVAGSSRDSVMTTSSGNLCGQPAVRMFCVDCTHCLASAAALLCNSSLYFDAALDVYFVFESLLASAAEPPCDWKYFVADSLPPTFITLS